MHSEQDWEQLYELVPFNTYNHFLRTSRALSYDPISSWQFFGHKILSCILQVWCNFQVLIFSGKKTQTNLNSQNWQTKGGKEAHIQVHTPKHQTDKNNGGITWPNAWLGCPASPCFSLVIYEQVHVLPQPCSFGHRILLNKNKEHVIILRCTQRCV